MNMRMANERQLPRGYTRNMVSWYNLDTSCCMLEHPSVHPRYWTKDGVGLIFLRKCCYFHLHTRDSLSYSVGQTVHPSVGPSVMLMVYLSSQKGDLTSTTAPAQCP